MKLVLHELARGARAHRAPTISQPAFKMLARVAASWRS